MRSSLAFAETLVFTLIIIAIISLTTFYRFRNDVRYMSDNAYSTLRRIANQLDGNGTMSNIVTENIRGELVQTASLFDGRILLVDDSLKIIYDTYSMEVGKTIISENVIKAIKGTETIEKVISGHYIEITLPIAGAENIGSIGAVVLRVSLENVEKENTRFSGFITAVGIIVVILFSVISNVFATVATRPIRLLNKAVESISLGDTDAALPVYGYREIRELTEAFNVMLKHMSELEEARKQFVSDVSHELKTPMTSMKLVADSLLGMESAPEELYREFLEDIDKEIERENKIINDLLELVKEEQKIKTLDIQKKEINTMLEGVVKTISPIAQKSGIKLMFDSYRQVEADVDDLKLSLAFSNLIENAVKYNHENGWVRVALDCDHKYFTVTVADSGVGIPKESLNKVFERFYRVDKTRSRETGGTGLGLPIAKNIILAHGGTITVSSEVNDGTTFIVKIPLVYNSSMKQNGGRTV